jgi:hypothetical protein
MQHGCLQLHAWVLIDAVPSETLSARVLFPAVGAGLATCDALFQVWRG